MAYISTPPSVYPTSVTLLPLHPGPASPQLQIHGVSLITHPCACSTIANRPTPTPGFPFIPVMETRGC
eukprot:754624-Hanusia_phi.AAC.1